jgi:hypothetical protein
VSLTGKTSSELICVNVGKRVQSFKDKPTVDQMKQQHLDGAQWIPAGLLEILPFQPMTGQMSGRQTTEMLKHALHYPAKNAGLIDLEGLTMMGVKSGNNELVMSFTPTIITC